MRESVKSSFMKAPWILVVILLGLTVFFAYQYFETKKANERSDNYVLSNDEAKNDILDGLEKVYALPSRDNVVITYIGNPEEFEGSDELGKTQKGDYFIKFSHLNHALLWREGEAKIVTILNTQSVIDVVAAGVSDDYVQEVAESIEQSSPSVAVRGLRADNPDSVSSNLIVVNDERFRQSAETLAQSLDGTVGELPKGETKDEEASLQIYLGKEVRINQEGS